LTGVRLGFLRGTFLPLWNQSSSRPASCSEIVYFIFSWLT
jgi:hypothetical protein